MKEKFTKLTAVELIDVMLDVISNPIMPIDLLSWGRVTEKEN